jgi:3-oxoacyl-[acyl-carrier-protein] synthase-3
MAAGGSRCPASAETVAAGDHYVRMNGREVYKFATRVLVTSAGAVLEMANLNGKQIDLYVPHQANIRIIDHAAKSLKMERERVFVNVDRYGNTSSASIPLALADARAEGRLEDGTLVLMTGMGAGLTWGSSVMTWTEGRENGH